MSVVLPQSFFLTRVISKRRGFSLVVSLVMMAMMLLVAISLVTFVVLESSLTEYRAKRAVAQANAISGLRIAIGQLQLLSGDDQRVTATADILGSGGTNASLPSGNPYRGKRYWTGVWATGGLDKSDKEKLRDWDYENPDQKPFLGWLVSGYDTTTETYSPHELPVAKSTANPGQGTETIRVATSSYDVDDSSTELITLVGAGTLGKKTGWEDKTVKVRRVPLEKRTNFQKSAKNSGSFAYWVGDEGVKARVNLVDRYADGVSDMTDWYRMMRAAPQRLGVEAIKTYSSFEDWWRSDMNTAKLSAIKTTGTARLTYVLNSGGMAAYADDDSSNFVESAKDLYHDVSFFSRGVFSDVYNGGLKTDLSVAFEMPWFDNEEGWSKGFRSYPQFHGSGDKNQLALLSRFSIPSNNLTKWWTTQPDEGLGFLYEIQTGYNTQNWSYTGGRDISILRGPTWDLLRNYYRLYKRETESIGYRNFKPQHDYSWTAVGITPYTYTDGATTQYTNSSTGDTGVFGRKASLAYMTSRDTNRDADRRITTPMVNGDQLIIPQAMRVAPVILRYIMRFSLIFNQDTQSLVYDPMMVVWNPYNVPIELFGIGSYFTKYYPVSFRLDRNDGQKWKYKSLYQGDQESSSLYLDMTYYSNNSFMETANAFRWFAGTKKLETAPRGTITLWPGEVKAVFPVSATEPKGKREVVASLGDTTYSEYSNAGYEIPFNYDSDEEKEESLDGVTFTVSVVSPATATGGAGGQELDMYHFYLFYPQGSNGQSLTSTSALLRSWMSTSVGDVSDCADENYLQGFGVPRQMMHGGTTTTNNVTFTRTGETGYEHAQKQPIAYIDLYKATASQTMLASPLLTNVRPWLCEPRNWDYSNASVTQGTSKNNFTTLGVGWVGELQTTSNTFSPIEQVSGTAFWGDDNTSANGQSNVVLFEIPQRPMHSLGQFQSIDASLSEHDGSYIVGNSYPPLALNDNTKLFYWPRQSEKMQPIADHSFAANLALFDRYFFSGINYKSEYSAPVKGSDEQQTISKFLTNLINNDENPLANKRVTFLRTRTDLTGSDKSARETAIKDELLNPNKSARDFLYEGMFNVNSTSVEAWKALLASLHDQLLSIDGSYSKVDDFPIIRFAAIIGRRAGANGASSVKDSGGNDGEGWRWYRSLNDSQIQELAEKIVEEVRLRGPFMSMSDFVNRRLTSNSKYSQCGALQSAIDNISGINRDMKLSSANRPASEFTNLIPKSDPISKAGATGYLTQGDILSTLGDGMAVRSDTFTIRAYGDVFGLSGTPQARAYCEAVVQRMPEWIAEEYETNTLYSDDNYTFDALKFKKGYRSAGNSDTSGYFYEKFERNTTLNPVNRLLGRRYKIVSFRWLSQDEI